MSAYSPASSKSEQILAPGELPLELIYRREHEWATQPLFTQPFNNGQLRHWTWAEAVAESRRLAAWIIAQNFPPASRIVILSKNCAWWIMADWAIWMAGHTTVPFFAAVRDSSLTALFDHAQPVACFVGPIDNAPPYTVPALAGLTYISFPITDPTHLPPNCVAWEGILQTQSPLATETTRDPEDCATIIYTSGTTGQPKGVMQSFRSLANMGKSGMPVVHGFTAGIPVNRVLSYLPLAHVSERALTEMALMFASTHIYFTEGLPTFQADLKRAHPTIFFSVPRLYIRFQQGVWEKLPQKKLALFLKIPILRGIIRKKILTGLGLQEALVTSSGSAPIPPEVIEWYLALGLHFMEGYGMTETGITHVPLPGQIRVGYVGSSVGNTHTRISPDGEVQVKGPMNLMGYFRNPELSHECFTEDGYFHTGDRGEIDSLDRLRIIGRLKEEFKTAKGKYVVPAQIEKDLALSPLFESVAVFGSGMTGPFVMAVLVPDKRAVCAAPEQRAALEPHLRAELERVNATLEHHEQLRFLILSQQPWSSDNGYLTPTLKVRRAVIEKNYGHLFNAWDAKQTTIQWLD
jgi:long-chain acyl-CoA synthetase